MTSPVVGIASDKTGNGYWLATGVGGVFAFGDAPFEGSADASPLPHPVTAIAATPDGGGYWLTTSVVGPTPVPVQPLIDAGCYTPAVQPATIILTCADYGRALENLQWSSWTPAKATGTGTYSVSGSFSVPTSITLSGAVSTSLGVEFSRATWSYTDPAAPNIHVTETQTFRTNS
jgi:hypothetical protein